MRPSATIRLLTQAVVRPVLVALACAAACLAVAEAGLAAAPRPGAQGPGQAPSPRERWEEARKFLPEDYRLADSEAQRFMGVIYLSVGRTQSLYVGPTRGRTDLATGKPDPRPASFEGIIGYFAEPSRVFTARKAAPMSLELTAIGKGVGKVFSRAAMTVTDPATNQPIHGSFDAVYVIVVGEPEAPAPVVIEIARLELTGRAIRKGSGAPVPRARITLVWLDRNGEIRGSYLEDREVLTDQDGRFDLVATNLPRGRFEVMIQLLGQFTDPVPLPGTPPNQGQVAPGIGVDNDLWPYQQNVLDVTPELARTGPLVVGDIVLEAVKLVDFVNRPLRVITPK